MTTDATPSHRELRLAETYSRQLPAALARRGLKPAFSNFYATRVEELSVLIAVLDTHAIGDHSRYVSPDLLHQLGTDLGGARVYLSNSTGIRYVTLLSPLPQLPRRVDLPQDIPQGRIALGVRFTGQPILLDFEQTPHLAVLGITGSGKSVFLQSLVVQAIRNGMQLLVSDIDQTTFGMLENHPGLLAPLANSPQSALELVERAIVECDKRAEMFKVMPGHPAKINEYNTLAVRAGQEPLPRVLVVLDEASSVLTALGGAKGAMGQALATLGWRGRKFGVHFVFAAQEFTKDITGPVRDQVGLSLCFRVRSGQMAQRMGCQGAERIPEERPGLAITDRHGPLQTYFVDKSQLAISTNLLPVVSPDEQALFQRALTETSGRLSIPILIGWGCRERAARRDLETWELRGWVLRDPNRDNARYITPKLAEILSNHPAGQTPSNRV